MIPLLCTYPKCGDRRTKRADKTKESLGMQEQKKPDTYHPSLPHVVTINGFQILLEKYQ